MGFGSVSSPAAVIVLGSIIEPGFDRLGFRWWRCTAIKVASCDTLFLHSSRVAWNVLPSRASRQLRPASASRRSGSSPTRGTRTIRNPKIPRPVRERTPSDPQWASASRSLCPPRMATIFPFLSLTSVRGHQACQLLRWLMAQTDEAPTPCFAPLLGPAMPHPSDLRG
jgi:hypothetical protein